MPDGAAAGGHGVGRVAAAWRSAAVTEGEGWRRTTSTGRVTGTAIQTVGAKGHDGLAILLVTSAP